ncbi:hypothetical protein TNCV_277091 [Trichonephila clavipes]|uniref:Uncharacterized protein n=1 Tax=Trichonephila clavipes TaxID=2585209 RepID=A0A8X6V6Y7_TRICX|nr:hypothetical protein TNCV_277091 [Trichonephila clavipes]
MNSARRKAIFTDDIVTSSLGTYPTPSIHVKVYSSEKVAKRPVHVAVGSLFIVWPRSRFDTGTESHNGHRSAYRATIGENRRELKILEDREEQRPTGIGREFLRRFS